MSGALVVICILTCSSLRDVVNVPELCYDTGLRFGKVADLSLLNDLFTAAFIVVA